jgi:hypothetical protein
MKRIAAVVALLLALTAGAAARADAGKALRAADQGHAQRSAGCALARGVRLAMNDDDRSMTAPDQRAKRKKARPPGKPKHGATKP